MKFPKKLSALAAGAALTIGASAPSHAALTVSQLLQFGYLTYGDALSVSLPINAYYYDLLNGGGTGPGNPYYVASGPGQIQDFVVVGTGTNSNQATTNFPNMDNAYATPNSDGTKFFSTPTSPDPCLANNATCNTFTADFTGDRVTTWDSQLGALSSFIGGAGFDPIFYFNNNQTSSGAAYEQSLAAWARIWVTNAAGQIVQLDANGNVVVGGMGWYFTNRNSAYNVFPNNGAIPSVIDPLAYASYTGSATDPIAGDNTATDYVLSGGQICIIEGVVGGPAYDCNTDPDGNGPLTTADYKLINHNLGANQAAYAIVFPEFNALLAKLTADGALAGYTLHGDVRLGCDPASFGNTDPNSFSPLCEGTGDPLRYARSLNNGYEQIFILAAQQQPPVIPEPSALALVGIGLLGSVAATRRRKSTKT